MNTPATSAFCPRCHLTVGWPEAALASQKEAIAAQARRNRIDAVKLTRPEFGMDLREAKCLVNHLTLEKGFCLRCKHPVSDNISICGNCRALNLDW